MSWKAIKTFSKRKLIFSLSFLLFFLPIFGFAQNPAIDEETKTISNQLIRNIYNDILSPKDKYAELAAFDENVLFENKYGLLTIAYEYQEPRENRDLYEIIVSVLRMEDEPVIHPTLEEKHYSFPILGLKAYAITSRNKRQRFFKLDKIVEKHMSLLTDHQQNYLTLQVTLQPEKEVYKVGERISFDVVVKNRSPQSMVVKNLNEKTLFFTINGLEWGTNATTADVSTKDIILKPQESVKRSFKGESFSRPGEVEIYSTYHVAYRGVLPFGKTKIRIEP